MLTLFKKTVWLIFMLNLVSCKPSQEVEVEVPMIALIANAHQYDQLKVKTYGFLKVNNLARLFVHREDALNSNNYHSILVNKLSSNEHQQLKICNNQYVAVTGRFKQKDNNHFFFVRELRIKGKPENKYSQLVCNIRFK